MRRNLLRETHSARSRAFPVKPNSTLGGLSVCLFKTEVFSEDCLGSEVGHVSQKATSGAGCCHLELPMDRDSLW